MPCAIASVERRTASSTERPSVTGGRVHDESPEWIPASSMCSITPPMYDVGAVAQRVDVDLDRVVEEPVHQHRALVADRGGAGDVAGERLVVVDDLHAAPARARRRAGRARGSRSARRCRGPRRTRWPCPNAGAGQPGLREHLAERAAVLGQVDRRGARADDRHAGRGEPGGEPERGLPHELDDDADDLAEHRSECTTSMTSSNVSGSK
jgi:hypothetical protein